MSTAGITATRPPNYHGVIICGSIVGGLGLAGSIVTIMISLTLGNKAVPTGLSGISSSLAVGGLLIAIVRLAVRPKWAVNHANATERKLAEIKKAQAETKAELAEVKSAIAVLGKVLTEIKTAVDAHARHVEREHGGLHEDAVDIGGQLAELRALVAGLRHQLQPEQPDAPERPEQQHHVSRQRKRRRRRSAAADGGADVIPMRARRAADALRRLSEHIKDDPAGK